MYVNLALMAFNLVPIPPLDGSNILRLFVPWRLRDRYDGLMRYGMWILLGVILLESFLNVPILSGWVTFVSDAVLRLFALAFGAR
jgi:Zn-dependent protease